MSYTSQSGKAQSGQAWSGSIASGGGGGGGGGGTPVSIAIAAGNSQTVIPNTVFGTALQVTVKDSGGAPVAGVTVTFTAPGSGASAAFSGGPTATAVTDGSGLATAPTLTANSIGGTYTITATVTGLGPVSFTITNSDGFPDFSAYVFQFDAIGIMDHKTGAWTQRPGSSPGMPPYAYLYSDEAAYLGGAVPYNAFNGRNSGFSVVSIPASNTLHGGIAESDDWTSVHARMIWLGSGIPPYEQPILTTDLDNSHQPLMLPVTDAIPKPESGAWLVNGKHWFIGRDTFNGRIALFSCPNPEVGGNWTYVAPNTGPLTGAPKGFFFKPQTQTAYVMVETSISNVEFYKIKISDVTPVWTGPFAAFNPTSVSAYGMTHSFGDIEVPIVAFDNGDLGIYFQADDATSSGTGAFYYVRYNILTSTWDAPVMLLSLGYAATFLIDPVNRDLVYVFVDVVTHPSGWVDKPVCMTVTRLGVAATVFSFPSMSVGGFGSSIFTQGLIVGAKIIVPLPALDPPNAFLTSAVWMSGLGGASFTPLQVPNWQSIGGAEGATIPWLFGSTATGNYVFGKRGGTIKGNYVG